MNRTIFLHIAAIFNDDTAPVAADGSAWTYIYILPDDDIARNRCLWVNEGAFVDNGNEAFEFVDHIYIERRGAETLSIYAISLLSKYIIERGAQRRGVYFSAPLRLN